MKSSLLWSLALLGVALVARIAAALLSTATHYALPPLLAAHLKQHLLPAQPAAADAAPALGARLEAGLQGASAALTLVLLPAALLFPGLVENWPSFLTTLTVPSLRLSLPRAGEVRVIGRLGGGEGERGGIHSIQN